MEPPGMIRCRDESVEVACEATLEALRRQPAPDAIIGGNDQMAIAAMKACAAAGLRVPDDVQVTGFNAFEIFRYIEPALTTVRSAAQTLGERAAEVLISRLHTGRFAEREIVVPVEVSPGKTTLPI
jgi:LacI family transcriptional regulator